MLEKAKRIVDGAVLGATVPMTLVMLACVVWQVFARYVLSASTAYTDEIARFLFIWVSLLGSAYVLGKRGHIAITLISERMPPATRAWVEAAAYLFVAAFALVVMVGGGGLLIDKALRLGQISPATLVPVGYVYIAIPLSGLLTAFYSIPIIVDTLRGRLQDAQQVSLD